LSFLFNSWIQGWVPIEKSKQPWSTCATKDKKILGGIGSQNAALVGTEISPEAKRKSSVSLNASRKCMRMRIANEITKLKPSRGKLMIV